MQVFFNKYFLFNKMKAIYKKERKNTSFRGRVAFYTLKQATLMDFRHMQ